MNCPGLYGQYNNFCHFHIFGNQSEIHSPLYAAGPQSCPVMTPHAPAFAEVPKDSSCDITKTKSPLFFRNSSKKQGSFFMISAQTAAH